MAASGNNSDIVQKLQLIGILLLGAVILIVHVYFYRINSALFSAFISLYVLVFTGIMLWYIYAHKPKDETPSSFDLVTYIGFYTALLQLVLLIMSVASFIAWRRHRRR